MEKAVEGRRALVTGSSRGIGRAIALRLAREGAHVAVHYREQKGAALGVAGLIRGMGRRTAVLRGDVARGTDAARVVRGAARALGGLDILVNNAGMILRSGSIEGTPEAAWDRVLGVNLKGPYLCTRAALPHLRRAPRADVLFVSSIAGLAPVSLSFHYGVAKAGLLSMTRYLAHQLGPRVRVNCIVPGFVDTDWHQEATPERRRRIVERTPLGRWGRPGDIAEVALYLLSREGDFVNGQSVVVDGGVTYTWD